VSREERARLRQGWTGGAVPPQSNGLVAAAARMTQRTAAEPAPKALSTEAWQRKAWDMYRTNGELRFGVNWLANALSRVNLIPAKPPTNAGDEPQPLDIGTVDEPGPDWGLRDAAAVVTGIAGGPVGQGAILSGITVHMMVPALCYVLATADDKDSFSTWAVLSQDEVRAKQGAQTQTGEPVFERLTGPEAWETIPDKDLLIKIWRQDRQFSWMPDSPVRSVLDSLDEIRLTTAHIRATAQSRLTGAGLLVIPSEVDFPAPPPMPDGSLSDRTPLEGFVDSLIDVAEVAALDQGSPAARIPLPVQVPGQYADGIRHVTFGTPFDDRVLDVRGAAIKRFALGVELPPEMLTGLGDVNHWGAWQIEESAITLYIEPMAEIPCHAFTVGYLKPALQTMGMTGDEIIVWYDTSDLRARPDRTPAAQHAYDVRVLSEDALLRETGLSADDKPDEDERRRRLLEAIALGNGALAPQALRLLGIAVEDPPAAGGAPGTPADTGGGGGSGAQGPPARQSQPPNGAAPQNQASAALLAAADAMVIRALERSGARLRSARGRRTPGGPAAVACADPALLHTRVDATAAGVSLDDLLEGAWDRVSTIADRYGVSSDEVTAVLDSYTRALIASGHAHTYDRLADALGLHAAV
jgi:hypothetical protein